MSQSPPKGMNHLIWIGALISVVDADGVVKWRNLTENWRVRVRPEPVIEALEGLR